MTPAWFEPCCSNHPSVQHIIWRWKSFLRQVGMQWVKIKLKRPSFHQEEKWGKEAVAEGCSYQIIFWTEKWYLCIKAAAQRICTNASYSTRDNTGLVRVRLLLGRKEGEIRVAPGHTFLFVTSPAFLDLTDSCGASLLCSVGVFAKTFSDTAGREESTSSGCVWACQIWACLAWSSVKC